MLQVGEQRAPSPCTIALPLWRPHGPAVLGRNVPHFEFSSSAAWRVRALVREWVASVARVPVLSVDLLNDPDGARPRVCAPGGCRQGPGASAHAWWTTSAARRGTRSAPK